MIGLPENEPATSLSRNGGGNDAHKPNTPQTPTPKVEDSVVEVGGEVWERISELQTYLSGLNRLDNADHGDANVAGWVAVEIRELVKLRDKAIEARGRAAVANFDPEYVRYYAEDGDVVERKFKDMDEVLVTLEDDAAARKVADRLNDERLRTRPSGHEPVDALVDATRGLIGAIQDVCDRSALDDLDADWMATRAALAPFDKAVAWVIATEPANTNTSETT